MPPHHLLIFLVLTTIVASVSLSPSPCAGVHTDTEGNIHVTSSCSNANDDSDAAAARVYINGVDVVGTLRVLQDRLRVLQGGDPATTVAPWVFPSGAETRQTTKLHANDAGSSAQFGFSVALNADATVAVIGRKRDSGFDGSVYIFYRSSPDHNNWQQLYKIVGTGSEFGNAVAVDGHTVVIAMKNDASFAGKVFIYRKTFAPDGTFQGYTKEAELFASDPTASGLFGTAVAVQGTTVVVGASPSTSGTGAVHVFERDHGGANAWGEVAKLVPIAANPNDKFGASVALDDGVLVAGSFFADPDGKSEAGVAVVFQRDDTDGSWHEAATLTADDGSANDQFGTSLAMSGELIVVGAPRYSVSGGTYSGAAYIFQRGSDAAQWTQLAKLTARDFSSNDRLGDAVAIYGTTAVVSASGTDTGSVYVFQQSSNSTNVWPQVTKLVPSDSDSGDSFGIAIAATANTILVGAASDDDTATRSGSAYVF